MKSSNETLTKNKIKQKIFDVIQIGKYKDIISFSFDIFITIVIIINLGITFFLTYEESEPYKDALYVVEFITIVIFTIEYILRIWTADYLFPTKTKTKARLKFIFSFYGLVDFFTIIPYFIPMMFQTGAVALRVFRVIRIFRLFKINSQYDAFNVIIDVIKDKKNQLLSSICMILIFMLASSLCMYSVEHDAQPEVYKNAFSGVWWSVSTLLTVGYGDIYPITAVGRVLAIVIAFLGVGMVAIPTGIISAGFVEKYTDIKRRLFLQDEKTIRYITSQIEKDSSWAGKKIKDIELPKDILIIMVLRDYDEIDTNAETVLKEGDYIIISSPVYEAEENLEITEVAIMEKNPWIGMRIKDIDISRQEYVVEIKRKGKVFIPEQSTVIKKGDRLLMYSRTME